VGAESRHLTFQHCPSEKELFKRWAQAVAEDVYQRGHQAYNGGISHTELSVGRPAFKTRDEAFAHADSDAVYDATQKRMAVAFRYGDPSKVFPLSAADKALVLKRETLQKESDEFERNVLKRFVASESASKKCSHCDSVISKKSRVRVASDNYARNCASLTGFELRDYIREQTACPACGNNLLMTDTDVKKQAALKTRLADLVQKVGKAETAFRAKQADYGYVVLAVAPQLKNRAPD
jgi:predicted RNA-binding Zn-ribbon protein involved in translation (DUF1610 family)